MSPQSTTRNRILDAALSLFNEEGVAQTSVNRIAAELGISPGNLHYHFKTKEEIADWLIRRFDSRMEAITATAGSIVALDDLWLILHLTLETIQEYRFVYREADSLMRSSPRIAQRIRRVTVHLVSTTQNMCANLAKQSVIRAAPKELSDLAVQMVFTATCWYTFAAVWPSGNAHSDAAGSAAYHVLTLLNPYLEEDARLYMTYLRSKYLK